MSNYALGARVRYHHRAAVARYITKGMELTSMSGRWGLFEGARKHVHRIIEDCSEIDLFAAYPEQKRGTTSRINKTVMVWPEEGVGVITGLVRRQAGTSHLSSRSYSGGWDEFEPGYFDPLQTFELYAIRHELRGTDYILVPTWAVAPDDGRWQGEDNAPATQEWQPGPPGDGGV